jgi:hypothetical protein
MPTQQQWLLLCCSTKLVADIDEKIPVQRCTASYDSRDPSSLTVLQGSKLAAFNGCARRDNTRKGR